jgi:gas vesicle protein
MDKKDAGLIGLGIAAAGGIGAAIGLGLQNRKLRKQIEMLTATIDNLNNDIKELKKKLNACKIFAFEERRKIQEQISLHQIELKEAKSQKHHYEQELKKSA